MLEPLHARIPAEMKTALGAIATDGDKLSDVVREALGLYARARVFAVASGVSIGIVVLLLSVTETLMSDADIDVRADALMWFSYCALAFDDARYGNTDAAALVIARCPKLIRNRAAALAAALKKD